MRYAQVARLVAMQPWAITPDRLAVISDLLALRLRGGRLSKAEIADRIGPKKKAASPMRFRSPEGGKIVAVIPVRGVISHRMGMLSETSGGTSVESLQRRIRAAVDDPSVSAIVLDVDSPGGGVYGVPELHAEIMAARETKKIVAVANSLAASAAYWIASAASEFWGSPSSEVGSIGVFAVHEDLSKALEEEGVRPTVISSTPQKTERLPFGPLTEEARAALQESVDATHATFLRDVGRGRGVKASAVAEKFGKGRIVRAPEALAAGMIDRIGTIDEAVARLLGKKGDGNVTILEARGTPPSAEAAAAAAPAPADAVPATAAAAAPAPAPASPAPAPPAPAATAEAGDDGSVELEEALLQHAFRCAGGPRRD